MTNVISFRLPHETRFEEDDHEMGVPGGGPVDYSDCDAGSPEWQERLKRAIAKYGPPCADTNDVELVQMLDEYEAKEWDER
jgi:hypothetical protein